VDSDLPADLLRLELQNAQRHLGLLAQNVDVSLLQPEILSALLEELSTTLEELYQQHENLITAHRLVETERQRYQALFEFAPDCYLVSDAQGVIEEANRAAAELLNLDQKFLIHKPLILFVAPVDRPFFHTKLDQLKALPELRNWELRLQPRRGEEFTVEVAVSTIRDRHFNLVGFRWLLRDVTLQKQTEALQLELEEGLQQQLEEERQLSQIKSRFIETVSHEFRTPLAIINLSTDLLERFGNQASKDKKRQYFQKIRDAIKHNTELIEEALTFNQVESHRFQLKPKLLELVQFCRDLMDELQLLTKAQQILQFICHAETCWAELDERSLQHVLINLLTNAIKYSPAGGHITVELTCQPQQVTFQIQDAGIGIPPEDQPHLFEPFHRASNVGTLPGTGLGLAIVKRMVELQKGTISVISEVNVGTSITVTFPLPDSKRGGVGGEKSSS
jgi:two-component system sensor histidine kinase VicK